MWSKLILQRLIIALFLTTTMFGFARADTQVVSPDVQVGNLWRYRKLDGFTNATLYEFTHRIVEVNDREIVVQYQNNDSKNSSLQYYNHDWNILDSEGWKFDPYAPILKFPMSNGLAWNQSFNATNNKSGVTFSSFMNGRILALEKVTVPAGVFEAYRIERDIKRHTTDTNFNTSETHNITWYAPSVRKYIRVETTNSSNGRVRNKEIIELDCYQLKSSRSPDSTCELVPKSDSSSENKVPGLIPSGE
jgi:hypothetical protein